MNVKENETVAVQDIGAKARDIDFCGLSEIELDLVGGGVGEVIVGHPAAP